MSGTIRNQANVLIRGTWSRENIGRIFAAKARELRDAEIRSGRAATSYRTYVDGKLGGREEDTKIGGNTTYLFNQMPAAVAFALAYVLARSPVGKGKDKHPGLFKRSWIVAVNGRDYSSDIEHIPPDATVHVVNITPYSRILQLGKHRFTLASHLSADLRQAVKKRFPTLQAFDTFVDLPPSLSRSGVRVPASTKRAGAMRYPAVSLEAR